MATAKKSKTKTPEKKQSKPQAKKRTAPPAAKSTTVRASSGGANLDKIPFSKLSAWKDNVRKTGATDNIAELEASILSMGLINPLTVMKNGEKYTVIAGNRRLTAISSLVKAGHMPKDYLVSCQVFDETIDATEISLAENVIRQNMHPADQSDAFAYLREKGMSESDIGARFGVTEAIVKKRLALSNVSPKIIKALRDGKIGLEHAQAFSVTDDQKAQEKVFKDMDVDLDTAAPHIRNALTKQDIRATDRRVRFVTLEAYKAAGGGIKRDLFEDSEDTIFLTDAPILNDLYLEKVNKQADIVKAEGWNWVQVCHDGISWSDVEKFDQAQHKNVALSKSDQIDLKDYEKELEALRDKDYGDLTAEEERRLAHLEFLVETLEDKKKSWSEKIMASAGCLIAVNDDGFLDIRRGLMTKQDAKKQKAEEKKKDKGVEDDADSAGQSPPETDEGMSKAVLEDLSIHRSFALSATLAAQPDTALRALVYTLALPVLYSTDYDFPMKPALQIDAKPVYRKFGEKAGLYKGLTDLLKQKNAWLDKTPEKDVEFWDWVMHKQDQKTLLELLAFAVAWTFDDMSIGGASGNHASELWREMNVDMSKWYSPMDGKGGESLFSRLGKPQLLSVLKELRGTDATPAEAKLKKSDLADLVSGEAGKKADAGNPWLPPILRTPEDTAAEEHEQKEAA